MESGAEIVMKRDDPNIAWGFRLTGGADLGTPFYVVKVLGRGHAERAGLQVGDMVYAINGKYINTFSHKDAQNAILHTGGTLTLNIRRGPFSGRGTPLPEYTDPFMGLLPPPPTERPKVLPLPPYEPPPKLPTPPESEEEDEGGEDTVAAFNVKINPKGRIAAIEELEVTPPPSRGSSRCRSRSRSASRDRRSSSKHRASTHSQNQGVENGFRGIPGPEETFTYSKEVLTQYSTVLSAAEQTGGHMSELINESFIIHGGSEHKMEDVLSPEDIERDIFEEKMEEQKITELLTGEAELLDQGVVGINFQKIIPKTDFIKGSNVFKELQDQCIKKEEPEEVQLQKDPTKRFSTFLQTPKRPIPKPKPTQQPVEDLPWKVRLDSQPPETTPLPPQNVQHSQTLQQEETITSTTMTESVNIVEEVTIQEFREMKEEKFSDEGFLRVAEGSGPIITEAVSTENVFDEKVRFQDESNVQKEESCSIEEYKEKSVSQEQLSETETKTTQNELQEDNSSSTEYKSEFERQLAEIQKQIQSIQQLPSLLQANLTAVQEQLNKIMDAKASADQKEKEEAKDHKRDSIRSQLKWEIDVTVEENKEETDEDSHLKSTESLIDEQSEDVKDILPEPEPEYCVCETTESTDHEVNELYKNMKNQQFHQREDDELSVCKPPIIRNFPRKVAERPIVLPGGRKWYKPKDAYNEDFIAETIIHQSEVLVGTTIGLNFRKYEPPKFDAANSAVYRLVSELESRCKGDVGLPIEGRPEKLLAEEDYFPPISKRHFFAARLAEQTNENVEKILQDANEQEIISV